jgi:hypothetical protein
LVEEKIVASKWLDGLPPQGQGFLIASLLFRSKDYASLFSYLAPEDASSLEDRALAIFELERGQRVRLLVTELKRLLLTMSQPWILAVHPTWILAILKREDRAIQRLALVSLHPNLIPFLALRLEIGAEELTSYRDLPLDLLQDVRRAIEAQLVPMRMLSFDSTLAPSQLLVLTKEELERLVLVAGVESLAVFLVNESQSVQREIAQRLDYGLGQKMLACLDSGPSAEFDFVSVLVQSAHEGTIDERFSKSLKLR